MRYTYTIKNVVGEVVAEVDADRSYLTVEQVLEQALAQGADLSGTDLRYSKLIGADLSGADLSGVDLSHSKLIGANLIGADLSHSKLIGTDLSDAKLNGANLIGADLSHSKLIGADLSHSKLVGTKFRDANLSGANLRGAGQSLKIIHLTGITYDVILFDQTMKIGCEEHIFKDWFVFDDHTIAGMDGKKALSFWKKQKAMLRALCISTDRMSEQ